MKQTRKPPANPAGAKAEEGSEDYKAPEVAKWEARVDDWVSKWVARWQAGPSQ